MQKGWQGDEDEPDATVVQRVLTTAVVVGLIVIGLVVLAFADAPVVRVSGTQVFGL